MLRAPGVWPVRRHQAGRSSGAPGSRAMRRSTCPGGIACTRDAQLEHQLAAAEIAGVPLGVGGGRGRRLAHGALRS